MTTQEIHMQPVLPDTLAKVREFIVTYGIDLAQASRDEFSRQVARHLLMGETEAAQTAFNMYRTFTVACADHALGR